MNVPPVGRGVQERSEDERDRTEVRKIGVGANGRRRLGEISDRADDVEATRAPARHHDRDKRQQEPDDVGGEQGLERDRERIDDRTRGESRLRVEDAERVGEAVPDPDPEQRAGEGAAGRIGKPFEEE
jgi:hypothetical protein